MRFATVAVLLCGLLPREGRAQSGPDPALGQLPGSFGRLGISAGMRYERGAVLGGQVAGTYYLTREDRPISFRVQGHASWSPLQTATTLDSGLHGGYASYVSTGSSRRVGVEIAAILHARPRSRVSPYLIIGPRISQRWQRGAGQAFDSDGREMRDADPWIRSSREGYLGMGLGIRALVGGRVFRFEAVGEPGAWNFSLGMSLPI